MSSMRSNVAFGCVTVFAGQHVSSVRAASSTKASSATTTTNHVHYQIAAYGLNDAIVEGTLRMWCTRNSSILQDNSLAFVFGKIHVKTTVSGPSLHIEAFNIIGFPGDPEDEDYEDSNPVFGALTILALGTSATPTKDSERGRILKLNTADYVRDATQESTLTCATHLSLLPTPCL
jgi:hypothetical protein